MIKKIGETPDGKHVVSGVFGFYETHGLPLEDVLNSLNDKGAIPCWMTFCQEAHKNGRGMAHKRIITKLETAIDDSYGPAIKDVVIKNLNKLNDENLLYVMAN